MKKKESIMEGNEKLPKIDENKNSENTASKDVIPIFSQEEIRTIIKEFISAYVRGDLSIKFMSAEERLIIAKRTGQRLDFKTAYDQDLEDKKPIIDLIAICTDAKQSSPEEKSKAIKDLFYLILFARSSGRLQGKFMTFDIEARLRKLEQDLEQTNKLVAELLITVRGLLSGQH